MQTVPQKGKWASNKRKGAMPWRFLVPSQKIFSLF
jgi:hypothetical protein